MSNEFKARRERRKRDRVEREKKNAYERARRGKHGWRALQLKSRYGLTLADFDRIVESQGGVCACCKIRAPIDVDHCHETNKLRGILCRACNVGIGLLGDKLDGVLAAVRYLQKSEDGSQ